MKTLLFLALFISVGAWGQTSKGLEFNLDGPPIGAPICTCTISSDGTSMSCSPVKACMKFFTSVDVPAIQDSPHVEPYACYAPSYVNGAKAENPTNLPECKWVGGWTCRDKSRTLMQTLDGKTHYCHRPQL